MDGVSDRVVLESAPMVDRTEPANSSQDSAARFGTFGGVFTPCTLTILGVIMFLRFGQVIGNAGLIHGLIIVAISKLITSVTTLSLSAIATNTRVRAGGAYFLISRSLGVSFGGAIGAVFFMAQAVSVSMYVIGFSEALIATFPDAGWTMRGVGSVVNVIVFACVYIGAAWAIKVQYFILAVLALSLISFFAGALGHADAANFTANLSAAYGNGESFFTMFALFFPAATGIMAGANMSGDLVNPARAIPRGTLASVAFTGLVYVAMAFALAAATDREQLVGPSMVVRDLSWIPWLITAGVFAATLSSALGSMMGAPRILQALSRDQIFPRLRLFGTGSGAANEPRPATVLTFFIAEAGVLLGDLNAIAPIITMFFMITYGYLNLATFYESITRNPSYRPTFKLSHWSTELFGAIACFAVMLLTSPLWAILAIVFMVALQWHIGRQETAATWGDLRSGAAFERARKSLLRLEQERYHPKNWRPSVLALSGSVYERPLMPVYGQWLTGGRGVLTLAQIIVGQTQQHLARRTGQEKVLRKFIDEQELEAFPAVLNAPSLEDGIVAMIQCHGIGAMRPNLILTGWTDDPERAQAFGSVLRTIDAMDRSTVILRAPNTPDTNGANPNHANNNPDPWIAPPGSIDVWWRGKDNGPLMLLLAHMLTHDDQWRGRNIRVIRMIRDEAGRDEATDHLRVLITSARLKATALVVTGNDFANTLRTTSRLAGLVIIGFQPPQEDAEAQFLDSFDSLCAPLGVTLLVHSTGDVQLDA